MNTEQEQALAEIAEREDREAQAVLIQAQAKRTQDGLAQAAADERFAEARRHHPYLSTTQIAAMLDHEPESYADAVHVNAIEQN
jgi:hypothetical protein